MESESVGGRAAGRGDPEGLRRGLDKLRGPAPKYSRSLSCVTLQRLSLRSLRGEQKCLNQLALSANGHPREPLVPFALWNLGLAIKPFRKKLQLRSVNLPALHAIE